MELHTVVEELPSGIVGETVPVVVMTIGVGMVPNAVLIVAVGAIVVVAFGLVFVTVRAQMSHEHTVINQEEDREAHEAGATPSESNDPDSPVERWDDSYNVYLETSLPDPHGLEADISVQGGRIFLCVSKRPADHDSARGNLSGAS